MRRPLVMRGDFTDANQTRQLFALALIYDGGIGRQIVRD